MKRNKSQFVAIRNGEHIAVEATAEAAGRKLEEAKEQDRRLYEAGWFRTDPATYTYYVQAR